MSNSSITVKRGAREAKIKELLRRHLFRSYASHASRLTPQRQGRDNPQLVNKKKRCLDLASPPPSPLKEVRK